MGKKVLVLASNGREHAYAWKLSQSPQVEKVYAAPGNGGTLQIAENVPISPSDFPAIIKFAKDKAIDLTIIEQDDLLAAGLADMFREAGLCAYGPSKGAAQIEASKAFSKDLMRAENIPTAEYRVFEDTESALAYVAGREFPLVVKASGLALGKGAVVCQTHAEAEETIRSMMIDKVFDQAGSTIVIEDFMKGREASIHVLTDGTSIVIYPPAEDHKQVFNGDKGPNTGGIGAVAPIAWINQQQLEQIKKTIVTPALKGLKKRGTPFTGHLYPGLMIDGNDIKVVEFNARSGDPETEIYLRLLKSDLFKILTSCANGSLDPSKVSWNPGVAVSVALCSKGYPGAYQKGLPIEGIEDAEKLEDIVIFHAGTTKDDYGYKTAGGRVLHVTATGDNIDDARAKAYAAIKLISFEGMHYRTDIGARNSNLGISN